MTSGHVMKMCCCDFLCRLHCLTCRVSLLLLFLRAGGVCRFMSRKCAPFPTVFRMYCLWQCLSSQLQCVCDVLHALQFSFELRLYDFHAKSNMASQS